MLNPDMFNPPVLAVAISTGVELSAVFL
jgi:hypothetical protein